MPNQPTKGMRQLNIELPAALLDRLAAICRPAVPGGPFKSDVVQHALGRYLADPPPELTEWLRAAGT
jgi:hypothetical protein